MTKEERKRVLAGKKNSGRKDSGKEKSGDGREQEKMTPRENLISWVKTIVGALLIVMVVNGLLIASFVVPTESMEEEVLAGDFVFVNKFVYGGSTPQTIPFLNLPLPFIRFPGIRDPERGDVIVFIYPGDRDDIEPDHFEYYLKRAVGVAGDTVEIRNNRLYINGEFQPLPEEAQYAGLNERAVRGSMFSTFPKGRRYTVADWGPMRVPKEGDVIPLSIDNYQEWETFIRREGHDIHADGQIIMIDGEPVDSYTVERDYIFGMGDNRDRSSDSRYFGFIPEENVVGTPLIVYWSWQPHGSIFEKLGSIRWNRIFKTID